VPSERSGSQEVALDDRSLRRIFVSEYVCGGGWPEETLEPSLAREGRAMLLAVVSDFLRLSNCEIVTTWDPRLGEFPTSELDEVSAVDKTRRGPASRLVVHELDSADEAARFEELCRNSDAALVIAPEFHQILARRTAIAATLTENLGSDVTAIELCSDKLRLAEFLIEHGIPTIPADALNLADPEARWPFPMVIKPRDGAGSLETFLIENAAQFERRCWEASKSASDATEKGQPTFEHIQQPFSVGEALSAAVICSADGSREFLPVCRQVLSDDGRFQYLGADWNPDLTCVWQAAADQVIERILDEIPGLSGYVGFDLIGQPAGSVQVVEINPRLTTGYLASRSRTEGNLAGRILSGTQNTTNNIAYGPLRTSHL
jgi:predicted ATP-grasp superfamily ATP-dependent carboligase